MSRLMVQMQQIAQTARPESRRMEQALFALRRGEVIILRDAKGSSAIIQAAEFADYDFSLTAQLPASAAILSLTQQHIAAFGQTIRSERPAYSLPVHNLTAPQIISLILGDKSLLPHDVSILSERADSLPALANQLLLQAKLLPAALVTRLLIDDDAQLQRLADTHHIPVVSERDISRYRYRHHALHPGVTARLPLSEAPDARMVMFRAPGQREEHFAVLIGNPEAAETPLVRIHSQCVTGDILGSLKCDCGPQLQSALHQMHEAGAGILIYLAQEGRDIGLLNKMRTYALQDAGLDTVEANHRLGFETDHRVFIPAAQMLKSLGYTDIKLLTNNPDKLAQLAEHDIHIAERVPLILPTNPHNAHYMATKKDRTGHLLDE